MYRCSNCGKFAAASDLVIDHIVPRSDPGYDSLANLQTIHLNCRPKKANWIVRLFRRIKGGR